MRQKGFRNAESQGLVKKSVLIAGHATSVSLEPPFWEELAKIAQKKGYSLNKLITEVDQKRSGNLSSTLRLAVLSNLQESLKTL